MPFSLPASHSPLPSFPLGYTLRDISRDRATVGWRGRNKEKEGCSTFDVHTEGGGGLPKEDVVREVARIIYCKIRRKGGGGPKTRKFCGRHMYMSPKEGGKREGKHCMEKRKRERERDGTDGGRHATHSASTAPVLSWMRMRRTRDITIAIRDGKV